MLIKELKLKAKASFSCFEFNPDDANYSIKWERWDFDIRDGSYGQAYFNGPKQTGEWNLVIRNESSPKSYLFAHIFRAAYTYYYKNWRWGIKAPPRRDGILAPLSQRLHIAGKDESGRSHYYDFNSFRLAAQVVVYSKDTNGIPYDSREIFGTTIHELAHASHWEIGYSSGQYLVDYIFNAARLPESWATGVEAVVTNDVYGTNNYNTKQDKTIAYMTTGDYKGYTCIVWDLIDDSPQRQIWGSTYYPDDRVSGYTLWQLELALMIDPGNWWRWRDNIRDMFDNPTENNLDYLFYDLQ